MNCEENLLIWHFQPDYFSIYRPLSPNEIRLLLLEPGGLHEPLQATLSTSLLGTNGAQYQALSYVWGSAERKGNLSLDGFTLPITENLGSCLRYMRNESEAVLLWIDAVCINQQGVNEKNRQVSLMPLIYRQAQTVCVWLGEQSESSAIGVDVLNYFATHPRPTRDAPWRILPPKLVHDGLLDVLSREWFQRIWVVQEVALGRRIKMICGSSSFSWLSRHSCVTGFTRMVKLLAFYRNGAIEV